MKGATMTRETLIERTSAAAYTASGGAVLFGLTANELAAYVGIAIAIATFCANCWFRWQHLQIVRKAALEKPDCATCPDKAEEEV